MKRPSIGVVIATPGRRSILRTINSLLYQGLEPGDDVLVVGDGYHEPTDRLVTSFGAPFRYVATKRTRDWGHSQVNYGLKRVGGDWVIIQDDDDVFLPRAFDEIRTIVAHLDEPKPLIGRVMTPYLGILWREPMSEPLDGHCIVVPNDKEKLGYMGLEYAGDQVWIASNLRAYETYTWADRIWTLTRPTAKLWPRLMRSGPNSAMWLFRRDDGGIWGEAIINLAMSRGADDDHWSARMSFAQESVTEAELREVAEFAAWAGQGSDVWLTARDRQIEIDALHNTGYQLHRFIPREGAREAEFIFEWPPHSFKPPEETCTSTDN